MAKKKQTKLPLSDVIAIYGSPPAWNLKPIVLKMANALRQLKQVPAKSAIVVSISCIDAVQMRELNKQYRGKDAPTDVLSFEQPDHDVRGVKFLGDLVLCIDVVRAQAKEQKHSIQNELAVLVAHGLLHVLGYDHEESEKDALTMAKAEQKLLAKAGFKAGQNSGLIERTQVKKTT